MVRPDRRHGRRLLGNWRKTALDFHYNPHYAPSAENPTRPLGLIAATAGPYPLEKEFERQNYASISGNRSFTDHEAFEPSTRNVSIRKGENAVAFSDAGDPSAILSGCYGPSFFLRTPRRSGRSGESACASLIESNAPSGATDRKRPTVRRRSYPPSPRRARRRRRCCSVAIRPIVRDRRHGCRRFPPAAPPSPRSSRSC